MEVPADHPDEAPGDEAVPQRVGDCRPRVSRRRGHRARVEEAVKRVLYLIPPIVGLVIAACSDAPEQRNTFDADAGAPEGGANLPPTADGSADAPEAPDARPPFDPKEEAVVCTANPCVKQLVAGD